MNEEKRNNKLNLSKSEERIHELISKVEQMKAIKVDSSRFDGFTTIGEYARNRFKTLSPTDDPSLILFEAALMIRASWQKVVEPRIKMFKEYFGMLSLEEFQKKIKEYGQEATSEKMLHWKFKKKQGLWRAKMLEDLVDFFVDYKKMNNCGSDIEAIRHWAKSVNDEHPELDSLAKMPNIGIKTVNWLRMFGAGIKTGAPDVNIRKSLSYLRLSTEYQILKLVADLTSCDPYELDQILLLYGQLKLK